MRRFPTRFLGSLVTVALAALPAATAAINPEEFMRAAPEVVRVREIARVEQIDRATQPTWRRLTLVVEVREVRASRSANLRPGDTLVIDYTVNLREVDQARRTHARRGAMPGPQFMHEPEPPVIDDHGEFWACLAPAEYAERRKLRRYAGHRSPFVTSTTGNVFVPVAGQYSFDTR